VPDLPAAASIHPHALNHLLLRRLLRTHIRQLLIKAACQLARFGIREIVASDPRIEPFQSVEDQTVNRITGSKRQTAEYPVIKLSIGISLILLMQRALQHFAGFFRMVTQRTADKNRGDVAAY